jgi:hypothetical protein
MSVTINGTNGLTFNDNSTQNTSPFVGGLGFRNRIINGDMRIDQRNNGASVTPTGGSYTLDRWRSEASVASKYSVQRSTVAPAGFTNSLLVTSLSAYTVGAAEEFLQRQNIEGFNVADLGWGTANAQAVTLSFWVRSSLTGTFGGSIQNAAANRCYPFSYTINAANTFEYKTVTISGDTTGTWATDSSVGVRVNFGLGVGTTNSGTAGAWSSTYYSSATGATSVVGTNGATFYITGVQLEKGSTATSFDYRPYGTELALCQRYYQQQYGAYYAFSTSGNTKSGGISLPVQMRTAPTVIKTAGTGVIGTVSVGTPYVNFVEMQGAAASSENREIGFILNCTSEL